MKDECCCHARSRLEQRKDRYGQDFQATCTKCGVQSGWHTSVDRAKTALRQLAADPLPGKRLSEALKQVEWPTAAKPAVKPAEPITEPKVKPGRPAPEPVTPDPWNPNKHREQPVVHPRPKAAAAPAAEPETKPETKPTTRPGRQAPEPTSPDPWNPNKHREQPVVHPRPKASRYGYSQELCEMAVDYERIGLPEDRMGYDIEDKISRRATSFGKDHPSLPKTPGDAVEDHYEEVLAGDRFKTVVDQVKRYAHPDAVRKAGMKVPGGREIDVPSEEPDKLVHMMMDATNSMVSIERSHRKQLEELAIDLVSKTLDVPRDKVQMVAELRGMNPISPEQFEHEDEEGMQQAERKLEKRLEEYDPEVAKRRMINMMIQGAGNKGHWMFRLAEDELNKIDPRLMHLYALAMSVNDLVFYWLHDMEGGEDAHAMGRNKIDLSGDKPKVEAQGAIFPILVHELVKGVYEVLSSHGQHQDREVAKGVISKADQLKHEIWDLRLGPSVWDKYLKMTGEYNDIKHDLYVRIMALPPGQFHGLMRGILSQSQDAKERLKRMAAQIRADKQYDKERQTAHDMGETDDEENELGECLRSLLNSAPRPMPQVQIVQRGNQCDMLSEASGACATWRLVEGGQIELVSLVLREEQQPLVDPRLPLDKRVDSVLRYFRSLDQSPR